MPAAPFYEMIRHLREKEAVLLFQQRFSIIPSDEELVTAYLYDAWKMESLDYPFYPPDFDEAAALWAAKVVYLSAQLILYRKDYPDQLTDILPKDLIDIHPGSILSADLCLRFLPDMLVQLKAIDQEDPLVQILENILERWHFSGVNYSLDIEKLNLDIIAENQCTQQLYVNRIVHFKNNKLAKLPFFEKLLKEDFGIYDSEFLNIEPQKC